MLLFSYVVLTIPLIVAASDGESPSLGIFEGLLPRFGPQVVRLHSRQTLLVPPECEVTCDNFQNTVEGCPSASCACTVQTMNTGFTCVECAVSDIPQEAATGQEVLDTSSFCSASNRISIAFAAECAEYGFTLKVPTVTLSGAATPSVGSPTNSAPTGSPPAPPTGLPSSYFKGFSAASTNSGGPSTTSQTSSTTTSVGSTSGAVHVGNKAGIITVLFSVYLTTVLVLVA